jgi:hypothetical protein
VLGSALIPSTTKKKKGRKEGRKGGREGGRKEGRKERRKERGCLVLLLGEATASMNKKAGPYQTLNLMSPKFELLSFQN